AGVAHQRYSPRARATRRRATPASGRRGRAYGGRRWHRHRTAESPQVRLLRAAWHLRARADAWRLGADHRRTRWWHDGRGTNSAAYDLGPGVAMSTRVFIADDHVIVREGLRRVLAVDPSIVVTGEAGNGHDVISAVRSGGFDVLLLDLSMPGRSGV